MRATLLTLCPLALTTAGFSQSLPAESRYSAGWADIAAVSAAGVATLVPKLLILPRGTPSCAPCSPAGLPGIDRWVVGANSPVARRGSDVLLMGISGLAVGLVAVDRSPGEARGSLAVLANAVGWTTASTEWLKVLVHRKRPVLYTGAAAAAAPYRNNQQSFPSGHTSVAFAVATSYVTIAQREHLPHRARNATVLFGSATAIGALRLAGGKHFPTDVIGGALLGSGIGWLVAAVHPRSP
ncbi:MAG TPA: phosphatase PAP2 family protein [Gemmatimonadales bacterium]|nr:phosphatase PAP2 family protein [Gemmatimonadales bacterium]